MPRELDSFGFRRNVADEEVRRLSFEVQSLKFKFQVSDVRKTEVFSFCRIRNKGFARISAGPQQGLV